MCTVNCQDLLITVYFALFIILPTEIWFSTNVKAYACISGFLTYFTTYAISRTQLTVRIELYINGTQ